MIERKTVVVVGAGASSECGLPTGHQLKDAIARLLNISFRDGYEQSSGDHLIVKALQDAVQNLGWPGDINPYLHAGRLIRDAMPQAISIDNFIDTHQGDARLELCGKLAIARAILKAERHSPLYVDSTRQKRTPDYQRLEDTWLNPFVKLLTESCPLERLETRLRSVAMVVFNYDRCIEHYVFHALQTYYGIDANQAMALVRRIEIFHPYGAIGKLPWNSAEGSVEFGGEPNARQLLDLARQIKTFAQGTDPASSHISQIHERLASAGIIIFLGFAYHRLNLDLLRSDKHHVEPQQVRYFGTAQGISRSDCDIIARSLTTLAGVNRDNVTLRNDLSCVQLFREYWRSLAL